MQRAAANETKGAEALRLSAAGNLASATFQTEAYKPRTV